MDTLSTPNDQSYAELRRSYVQLKDQHEQIQAAMQEKKSALELEFSKFMLLEAAKIDLDIGQLFKRKRRGKSNGTGAAKSNIKPIYRDPANPQNTWTGRGRAAKWLDAYIKQGRSKDEFKIKDAAQNSDTVPQVPDKDDKRSSDVARDKKVKEKSTEAMQPRDKR